MADNDVKLAVTLCIISVWSLPATATHYNGCLGTTIASTLFLIPPDQEAPPSNEGGASLVIKIVPPQIRDVLTAHWLK
jgi:hypothetical protein